MLKSSLLGDSTRAMLRVSARAGVRRTPAVRNISTYLPIPVTKPLSVQGCFPRLSVTKVSLLTVILLLGLPKYRYLQ